jgi:peptidyl-dipeptidase Dcp
MRFKFILMLIAFAFSGLTAQDNPLLTPYDTPYNVPPFEKIKIEHFIPAFEEGIKQQEHAIQNIITNPEGPTFENTIVALEYSGYLLGEVSSVFYNMLSANTSKELQEAAKVVAPILSKHNDNILLNKQLFERVKIARSNKIELEPDEKMLVEETYKMFVRGGADLSDDDQSKLREINSKLSVLSLKFGENLLAETNNFKLIVTSEKDLAGLPQTLVDAAYEAAKKAGQEGKWLFTLQNPSIMPFLTYAKNRELRQEILSAYMNRGNNNNEYDNKEIIKEIVNLRLKRANLLGYKSHAAFVLEENMAKTPEKVLSFLNELWIPSLNMAKKEAVDLQALIDKEGKDFKLQPCDWRYYTEKLRKEKYDIDEETLRQYFELNNVKNGIFTLVNKLYGLTFKPVTDIPKPHEETTAYEVNNFDGSYIGILYLDFHPRASKRGGAWMSSFRKQYTTIDGKNVNPIITVTCNFSRPTGNTPSLLTYDEAETFFHEFGHAIHGLLSKGKYPTLTGTSVPRDFVELPSQIMENWAAEKEVLAFYAKHYKTGETIPDELVEKMENSSKFNQGFITTELLAASLLDMSYHNLNSELNTGIPEFEVKAINEIGLIPEILPRYRTTYFNHIFSSGYSAGYYSYIWAQVLDADAFEAFKIHGLFDKETAASFRSNILEKGGSEDPMVLYKRFRGAEPDIKPLLKRKGFSQ